MATAQQSKTIAEYAEIVDQAAMNAAAIKQFPASAFDVDTAYAIQAASVDRRLQRGEYRTGVKMGFTSKAKMRQMDVHDLIWGRLTSGMMIDEGGRGRLVAVYSPARRTGDRLSARRRLRWASIHARSHGGR